MADRAVSFDEILAMASQLSPIEKVRLLERVASTLEHDISAEHPGEVTLTWADEELHKLMTAPRITPAELVAWLEANPNSEPWGDLKDDDDPAEYIHRIRH